MNHHPEQNPSAREVMRQLMRRDANHSWLTADRGWQVAGALHADEPVRLLDGATARVAGLQAVAGVGVMWDLSLDATHAFAVGAVQVVVHNTDPCGVTNGETGSYGSLSRTSTPDTVDFHHMPADSYIKTQGVERNDGFAVAIEHENHRATWTYKGRAKTALDMINREGLSFPQVLELDLQNYRDVGGVNPDQVAEAARAYWTNLRPDLMGIDGE